MLQEMGNVHKTNLHLHHHQRYTQAPVVLSMLRYRSSFKDARWDQSAGSHPSCDDYNGDDGNDPLSPKVGCMGQVKRNNGVVGFPTPVGNIPVAARASDGKYSKLKRIFSAAAVTKPASPAVNSCRVHGRSAVATTCRKIICEKEKVGTASIADMDPPLPVTRKAQNDRNSTDGDCDRDRGDLWKRRLGGMDLKKLELQKTPIPEQLLTV